MGKIIKNFLNMHCDVYYYLAKFEIKIQLVYGETKKTTYVWRNKKDKLYYRVK